MYIAVWKEKSRQRMQLLNRFQRSNAPPTQHDLSSDFLHSFCAQLQIDPINLPRNIKVLLPTHILSCETFYLLIADSKTHLLPIPTDKNVYFTNTHAKWIPPSAFYVYFLKSYSILCLSCLQPLIVWRSSVHELRAFCTLFFVVP